MPLGGHVKRALDIVLSLAALVLFAPLITVALLARWLLGKPLITAETRIGFGGRQFLCYRFITPIAGSRL
ncbi:MAG: sugar transferase, partial [Hyphomicrobiaceae bacterium]